MAESLHDAENNIQFDHGDSGGSGQRYSLGLEHEDSVIYNNATDDESLVQKVRVYKPNLNAEGVVFY